MAQQTVDNGDSGLEARTKINDNFSELYGGNSPFELPFTLGTLGTLPITPENLISKLQTNSASGAKLNGIFFIEQTGATTGSAQGVEGYTKTSNPSGTVVVSIGTIGNIEHSGAGTLSFARAVQAGGVVSGAGTVTNWIAFYAQPVAITGSGTVTTVYGLYIDEADQGGGSIADRWGVFVNDVNAKNYFKGGLLIGGTTQTANTLLDLQSTTHAFCLPRMTKAQRDAIGSPSAGMMVYQTDNTPGLRTYNGTNWMRYTETAD